MTNHFIVFIGAGASDPFGIPTMTQMARDFKIVLSDESRIAPSSDSYELYEIIESRLQDYQWFDIEALITVLQDIIHSDQNSFDFLNNPSIHFFLSGESEGLTSALKRSELQVNKYRHSAEQLLKEVRQFIVEVCVPKTEAFYIYDELFEQIIRKQGYAYMNMLDQKRRDINCEIFTTNYDMVLETYCDRAGHDGLARESGEVKELLLKLDSGNKQLYNAAEPAFKIYKLHGSINWYEDERGRLRWQSDPVSVGSLTMLGHQIMKEILIYPAYSKYTFREPFYTMFHHLKSRLLECEVCYVVGYSFRDEDVLGLFKDSMNLNRELRICLIDIAAEEIAKEKFGEFDNRILGIPDSFIKGALGQIASMKAIPNH
jgi:hypothetical protein